MAQQFVAEQNITPDSYAGKFIYQMNALEEKDISALSPQEQGEHCYNIATAKHDVFMALTNALFGGLNRTQVARCVMIISLVLENGCNVDDLQSNLQIFIKLCLDSDFSIENSNIDLIVNKIKECNKEQK